MEMQKNEKKAEGKLRAERLKYVRKKLLRLTQDTFCQDSDIPKQTYSAWEMVRFHGLTEVGAERVLAHYQKLGVFCTKPWLLYGIGNPPIRLKEDQDFKHAHTLADITEELLTFTRDRAVLDLYITDNQMLPLYEKNDLVAGYIQPFSDKVIGKNCIVLFQHKKKQNKTVGRLYPIKQQLLLCFLNNASHPLLIEDQNVISIAPVIWHRKCDLD